MDFVTIGEYADSKERQREFLSAQRIDLTAGEGRSEPFSSRTSSIRVVGNVPHFFRLAPEGEDPGEEHGQYRGAEAIESHNVDSSRGSGWVMYFKVED